VLAAIATAVARNFCFWCGTHCCISNPFLALVVIEDVGELYPPDHPAFHAHLS
jgi:hypothetical protein